MRSIEKITLIFVVIGMPFVLLFAVFVQTGFPDEQKGAVVIIGSSNIPQRSLSKMDIQHIFLGKKTKADSTKITFVTLKGGDIHEIFLREYLSRTPAQYTKYWKKLIFTGQGNAPKAFETEEDLVEYVRTNEGVIGYISANTAKNIGNENLQQFTVQ